MVPSVSPARAAEQSIQTNSVCASQTIDRQADRRIVRIGYRADLAASPVEVIPPELHGNLHDIVKAPSVPSEILREEGVMRDDLRFASKAGDACPPDRRHPLHGREDGEPTRASLVAEVIPRASREMGCALVKNREQLREVAVHVDWLDPATQHLIHTGRIEPSRGQVSSSARWLQPARAVKSE
jgi:hypothetical protein